MSDPPKRDLFNRNAPLGDNIPIRTYSQNHPQVGFLEFSIPFHSPTDVEVYLLEKLSHFPVAERLQLYNELMKVATDLWQGFALWVGDPDEARMELRRNEEMVRKCKIT